MQSSDILIEARTYDLVVGKVARYVANYQVTGLPVSTRHALQLAGYFRVELGHLNPVVHYWLHQSLSERQKLRKSRDADPD